MGMSLPVSDERQIAGLGPGDRRSGRLHHIGRPSRLGAGALPGRHQRLQRRRTTPFRAAAGAGARSRPCRCRPQAPRRRGHRPRPTRPRRSPSRPRRRIDAPAGEVIMDNASAEHAGQTAHDTDARRHGTAHGGRRAGDRVPGSGGRNQGARPLTTMPRWSTPSGAATPAAARRSTIASSGGSTRWPCASSARSTPRRSRRRRSSASSAA